MALSCESIEDRIEAIVTELATTNWGPDVSDQGRSIQLNAYRMSLTAELKQLMELRAAVCGPFTVVV